MIQSHAADGGFSVYKVERFYNKMVCGNWTSVCLNNFSVNIYLKKYTSGLARENISN